MNKSRLAGSLARTLPDSQCLDSHIEKANGYVFERKRYNQWFESVS